MDLANTHRVLLRAVDGAILTVLAGTTRPLTGGEVARLAVEGSQAGIWKALKRLVAQGVVLRDDAGRAALYRLNREHLAAPAVEVLTSLRTELIDRLRSEIDSWQTRALHASLFGSVSRREADADSDIDLLLVRLPNVSSDDMFWSAQVDELAQHVHAWTGNRAGISDLSPAELELTLREQRPIAAALKSDAITLIGPSTRELIQTHG